MDLGKWAVLCGLGLFGISLNAASFDCKKALDKTEKLICGNSELLSLDSKLEQAYQRAYTSDPANQANLLIEQRDWLTFVRGDCGDDGSDAVERCLRITYGARIDQLDALPGNHANDGHAVGSRMLNFMGIQLGEVLNDKQAHEVFRDFSCDKQPDKLLSSIKHKRVISCRGKLLFENQPMDATIELYANRRVGQILLLYDTPYSEGGVNSTSVSDMENRLIAAYGQPDILRIESTHQPVQIDPKDLLEGSDIVATDQGDDQWAFAGGASIVMGPGGRYQKEQYGHIFNTESITFSSDRALVVVTLPAQHPIPVILTKVTPTSGSDLPWKANELMTIQLYPGGKRTCRVGALNAPTVGDHDANYTTTITCTDFVQVTNSVTSPPPVTIVSIVRDGSELAEGYIPVSTAVADIERR
jgi:uncharacterized protein